MPSSHRTSYRSFLCQRLLPLPIYYELNIASQVLIPISLYVSIEFVKLGHIFLIRNDLDLYDEASNRKIQCGSLNIAENLGQIEYVFSDKTGTLTENKMVFRRCSIAGLEYGHEENGKTEGFLLIKGN